MAWRVICVGWALTVGWSEAAETSKLNAVNGEAAAAESIAATKRDLERIRAASDPRFQGSANGSAPRVSVPALRTDSVEAAPPSPPPSAPASSAARRSVPEKNAGNWLVDAMGQGAREKDERQRAAKGLPRMNEREGRQSPEVGRTSSGKTSLTEPTIPGRDAERGSHSTGANPAEKRVPTSNPLAPFLGDWLTPHDLAMLSPGVGAEAGRSIAGVGDQRQGVPLVSVNSLGAPSLKHDFPGGYGSAPLPGLTASPSPNPFLASLVDTPRTPLPAPSIPPALLAAPPAGSERAAQSRSAPDLEPVSPKIPDVAKPRPDETYFKQLKRF